MDRQVKEQLKHDEFLEGSAKVFHWLERNPKPFLYGAGAVVAAVALGWGVSQYLERRAHNAADMLAQGTAALNAPVVTTEAPRPNDEFRPTFANDAERAKQAAARLEKAAGAGGATGSVALYLRGVALIESGDGAGAVKALEEAQGRLGGDATLGDPVRAALAQAYAAAGQHDKSAEAWRALSTSGGYPKELALTGLAEALEKAGKTSEARATYEQIVREFGTSPVAAGARAAIARLAS
jgi:tetratricopeptide (TPR) repeat protein